MLFAPATASVIEFPLRPHFDRAYGYMAMALGLDYWIVPEVSTLYHGQYHLTSSNIASVVRLVKYLLFRKGILVAEDGHTAHDSSDASSMVHMLQDTNETIIFQVRHLLRPSKDSSFVTDAFRIFLIQKKDGNFRRRSNLSSADCKS